ncbi:MAG TPA: HEAT repeat domain-containing protein [Chthonomonas sp.]|uniref:HEAT repeat domain-containing protein n=1 Tax=Chthonomonas sp. TaxID=2282153 RepID=UPI002B4AFC90|nr:HEAT repeat domain-containing protein [Chthonomonas sp.]HLI49188.1 HEAT repeat domain-containing protein [Chthonomonas sp.]
MVTPSVQLKEGYGQPPPMFAQEIAQGRSVLANASPARLRAELYHAKGSLNRLLVLLWHKDERVRTAAALALSGGDGHRAYIPRNGHFAGALLRRLAGQDIASTPHERLEQVSQALYTLLEQSANDLRGMANMHYSFLSSALYLALLGTCRDTMASVRRLRAAAAHKGLCRLLYELKQPSVMRRLNAQDAAALAHEAALALAAMPPQELSGFWHGLMHGDRRRRLAYAEALWAFSDRRVVPYLLQALEGQHPDIAIYLVRCLARLGDPQALSALERLASARHRALRQEAAAAMNQILQGLERRPSRLLLRPATPPDFERQLLRPLKERGETLLEPEELLRSHPQEANLQKEKEKSG